MKKGMRPSYPPANWQLTNAMVSAHYKIKDFTPYKNRPKADLNERRIPNYGKSKRPITLPKVNLP